MTGTKHATPEASITLTGVGVHSGQEVTMTILPDPEGPGIRFRRTDLEGAPHVPADLEHVADTDMGTTLAGEGEARVLTVEHLMAAFCAAGVSRAVVELDGPEIPIRDGSFMEYLGALDEAGVRELDEERPVLKVPRAVSAEGGQGSSYVALPGEGFRISATIQFSHPAIGRQYGAFEVTPESFRTDLAPARTFGFKAQAEELWARGLARGSSLENTVILDEDAVLNDGLRFPDEFLRHKVGDVVGDLALLGARVEGHIVADRPSHRGNVELARVLAREARRSAAGEPIVDIQKIIQYLPHRYPMLLVDRIVDYEEGKRIVGVKNVTINEPFFQGHYPGHPIMPGVLIIEAMAQVGGLLLMDTLEDPSEKVVYFMSLDNVKWRRPVTPGDQIVFELELLQLRRSVCRMRGEGYVDGNLVAEAELMARIMDR